MYPQNSILSTSVRQTCYFNIISNHNLFRTFISKRIRNSAITNNPIHFQVERVLSTSKNSTTFEATSELKDLLEKDTRIIRSEGKNETDNRKKSQQDQDFFLCNDANKNKEIKKKEK